MNTPSLETRIKAEARRLGFVLCGITKPESVEGFQRFEAWLEKELHADMGYLARPDTLAKRQEPGRLLANCKSVICVALPYPPAEGVANIAAYARVPDYHIVLREKLEQLVCFIEEILFKNIDTYIAVDSSPVLEKSLAVQAGLGLIGRNTLLINETYGSSFFLGELFLDLELQADEPLTGDYCGDCTICVDACPTNALLGDKTMDASRCLSYLTVENRGNIPPEIRWQMSGQVIGCDICQLLCPMNQGLESSESDLGLYQVLPAKLDLPACLAMDEESYKAMFGNTAVSRLKYKSFRRNVILAMADSISQETLEILKSAIVHEADPICKDAMQWAIEVVRHRLSMP